MTDDPTLDALAALDRRGHAAATGLRSAVLDRPAPVFEPDVVRIDIDARPARPARPEGGRRSRSVVGLLVAAAAVLVVVAAVVALIGTDPDPDDAPADRIAPEDLRRYVLGDVPRGFGLAQLRDLDTPRPPPSIDDPGPMTVYGPDVLTPMLGVFRLPEPGPGNSVPSLVSGQPRIDGQPGIDVGPDRRAWDMSEVAGPSSIAIEIGDVFVGLIGVDGVERDLAALVEVVDDRPVVPAADLPEGWSTLGDAMTYDGFNGTFGLSAEPDGSSWMAMYGRRFGTDRQEYVLVSSATGDSVRATAGALGAEDVEHVVVRGHDAVLAHYEGEYSLGGYAVTWEERPGEIVQVVALDTFGRAGLLGLAEEVEVVGADAVADLRRETLDVFTTDPGVTVVGRGTFSTGADWLLAEGPAADEVLVRTTANQLTGWSFDPPSSAEAAGSDAPLGQATAYGVATDVAWVYGLISDEVAELRITGEDGTSYPYEIVETDGIRGWVAELPPGPADASPVLELVALAADGTELESRTVGG